LRLGFFTAITPRSPPTVLQENLFVRSLNLVLVLDVNLGGDEVQ